jgi:hypothetical protein
MYIHTITNRRIYKNTINFKLERESESYYCIYLLCLIVRKNIYILIYIYIAVNFFNFIYFLDTNDYL